MAKGFSATATINRPVEQVWSFMTDFNQAPKWMTGVSNISTSDPAGIGIGSTLGFESRGATRESKITGWKPPHMMELTSIQGGMTAVYCYSLTSIDDHTTLTLDVECHASGLWRILYPVIVIAMRASDSKHPDLIKSALEN